MKTTNQEQVNTLFEQHESFIKMQVVLIRRTFYLTKEDFEDCLQEANIAFLKAIHTYKEGKGASFETYASKVIKNALLDYTRKLCRNKEMALESEVYEYAVDKKATENQFKESEIIQYLKEIYQTTESKTTRLGIKTVVMLANGYDYKQIANVLKVNEGTLRSAVSLFRKSYAIR